MDCHAQDNPGEGSPFFSLPIDDSGLPDLTDLDDGQVQDHVNASRGIQLLFRLGGEFSR